MCWELQRFLNRIGNHPVLAKDDLVHKFCYITGKNWKAEKKMQNKVLVDPMSHVSAHERARAKKEESAEDARIKDIKQDLNNVIDLWTDLANYAKSVNGKRDGISIIFHSL